MKVGENMFVFLFNGTPIIRYKELVYGLKYDAETQRYYVESYGFNNKYEMVTYTVTTLDSDGIVFLCKLLARFRSLIHQ